MKSTILHLEGAFSGHAAHRILSLQPAPPLDNGRPPDIQ